MKNWLNKKLVVISIILTAFCSSFVFAQDITKDQFFIDQVDRKHWEPGGKYFDFRDRGTIVSRSGGVTITSRYKQRTGNFSLQGAEGKANYQFVNDLDRDHFHTDHAPFADSITNSSSNRINSNDGTQKSINLNWTGTLSHPADSYDGVQGSNYPVPQGARDIFEYNITSTATAVYPLTTQELQMFDPPKLDLTERVGNAWNQNTQNVNDNFNSVVSVGLDQFNVLREVGNVHNNNLKQNSNLIAQYATNRYKLGIDGINTLGSATIGYGTAALGGLISPFVYKARREVGNAAVFGFKKIPVGGQFTYLKQSHIATTNVKRTLRENPYLGKSLEAAGNVLFVTGVGVGAGVGTAVNVAGGVTVKAVASGVLTATVGGIPRSITKNLIRSLTVKPSDNNHISSRDVLNNAVREKVTDGENTTLLNSILTDGDIKGLKTEELLANTYRNNGYTVLDGKYSGNKGIDSIAIKDGNVHIIEAKQYSGDGGIQLQRKNDNTQLDPQMSHDWIVSRVEKIEELMDSKAYKGNITPDQLTIIKSAIKSKSYTKSVSAVDKTTGELLTMYLK